MAMYFILASVPLAWRCFTAHRLFRNNQRALKFNVPLVYTLVSSDNAIWIALQTVFPVIFAIVFLNAIPFLHYGRTRLVVVGRIWKF